uniref:CpsF n=1 Tax=Streptococcus suis TaxID=1307 RepID=A0A1P8VR44_STRSU|nr:cpsF [Streptococcus suis]
MKSRVEILGVTIDPLTMSETIQKVEEEYIQAKTPLHLMGVNADKINLCQSDQRLMRIVNECGIINADGASVVLAGKYLGIDIPERVAGIDLMQELLKLCQEKGYSTYFLGAKEEVLQKMLSNFREQYPKLQIAGSRNGYFSDDELPKIMDAIRLASPSVVFVGITSPKKEYIVEEFLKNGLNSVFMGVGGSFDVLSGTIPRAPQWMQKANLEWLFRVANEPRRLFKRYFVGNMTFIRQIIKERNKL